MAETGVGWRGARQQSGRRLRASRRSEPQRRLTQGQALRARQRRVQPRPWFPDNRAGRPQRPAPLGAHGLAPRSMMSAARWPAFLHESRLGDSTLHDHGVIEEGRLIGGRRSYLGFPERPCQAARVHGLLVALSDRPPEGDLAVIDTDIEPAVRVRTYPGLVTDRSSIASIVGHGEQDTVRCTSCSCNTVSFQRVHRTLVITDPRPAVRPLPGVICVRDLLSRHRSPQLLGAKLSENPPLPHGRDFRPKTALRALNPPL